jgi:cytochrome c oxidase subunit 4
MSAHPPTAPDSATHHAPTRTYLIVQIVSIVLTVVAFYGVIAKWLPSVLLPFILALAAVQLGLQAVLFMHLNLGRRAFGLFFAMGLGLAAFIGAATMIMMTVGAFGAVGTGVPTNHAAAGLGVGPASSTTGGAPGAGSHPAGHGGTTTASLLTTGLQILQTQCEACHTLNGHGGTLGPDLNLVLEGKINKVPGGDPTNAAWLTKWISNPQAVWSSPKNLMPKLPLTSQQIQGVVLYLTTKVK